MTKRDRLLPAAALLAVLTVAVIVISLLRSATTNGTDALEDAKVAQVLSTANSFNSRIESSIGAIGGLGARPWELLPGSAADEAALRAFAIDPEAISGFFLVDDNDTIVNGILLRPGRLGSTYAPPDWAEAKARLASVPAVVLPVTTDGATSELPSYAFAVAIRGANPNSVRGAFVFEQAITADSSFNLEIRALVDAKAKSAAWRFVDSKGSVIASSLSTGLGEHIPNPELATLSEGRHVVDGDLVVSADVPAVGWHLLFTQRQEEFEEPLAGPLQTAGLILAILLMIVGVTLTVALAVRLRQAREEEQRLRELHRAQDEFISVVSHELRTPVSGILGFLQTTLDHWHAMTDEDRQQAVRRAFLNARRLQAMARDVLDTESIESGEFGYDRHPIDLAEEVRAAVGAADDDGTQLVLSVPERPVMIHGDSDRIQQVLSNLLDNALKFSSPDTVVAISLEQTGDTARVTVVDRGATIEADQLDRIFDKFVRVHEGTATGTGLGLYIARRIIEAHDGKIWAESHAGGETRFIVELPCRTGQQS